MKLTDAERVDGIIKVWSKTIDVQMHFNDICIRIRTLAFTSFTFTYGAAFITLQKVNPVKLPFFTSPRNPAFLVAVLGLILWAGFWALDSNWYHLLLRGSVTEGTNLERILTDLGIPASLTNEVSKASHHSKSRTWWGGKGKSTTAKKRLDLFYILCGVLLVALGCICYISGIK